MLTIADVRDLVEHDDVPLRYLSLRMGQRPFWKLYYECHPGMRGQPAEIASFICPPGILVSLDRILGRDGYSMDVADQYYADIETGVLARPRKVEFSEEDAAKAMSDLHDLLYQARDADPVEPERVEAAAASKVKAGRGCALSGIALLALLLVLLL